MAKSSVIKVTVLQDSRGSFDGVEDDLARVGDAAVKTSAIVGGALVGGAVKAAGAASDLGESVNAVEKVFGDSAGAILSFGDQAASTAGMSARQWNEAAVTIGGSLQTFGYEADEAAAATEALGVRAADLASVYNMDLDDAIAAIGSGLRGESEPLRKVNVNLDAATLKAKAAELGLYDGVGALDAHTKALAAEAVILEQSNDIAGDFADTSGSMANRQRTLAAETENTAAAIGVILVPYMETALGLVQGLVEWVGENTEVVAVFATGLAALAGTILAVNAAIKIARTVMVAWRAISAAVTIATWLWNFAMYANPIGLIVAGIVLLIAVVAALVYKFRDKLLPMFKRVWDAVKEGVTWVKDKLGGAFQWVSDKIAGAVDWLRRMIDKVKELLANPIGGILDAVGIGGRASTAVVSAAGAATARQQSVNYTVSVSTVSDSESTAREIQRVLAGSSWRNGRRDPGFGSW